MERKSKTQRKLDLISLFQLLHSIYAPQKSKLNWRLIIAFGLLILSKVLTLLVPFAFKWIVDSLDSAKLTSTTSTAWFSAHLSIQNITWLPVYLVVLYGIVRCLTVLALEGKNALFALITMSAVQNYSSKTFTHIHDLSLQFHLERKTGSLTRILERGRKGIEDFTRLIIQSFLPTFFELIFVVLIFIYKFSWIYSVIVLITIALYLLFTYIVSEWRIKLRREMNRSEQVANTIAVDSLLNYETVKYFNAERHEQNRFDHSISAYVNASVKTYESLAFLNAGQAIIYILGSVLILTLCTKNIIRGESTLGDFVFINTILIQLGMPLNFIGMLYRDLKQSLTDLEEMSKILHIPIEIKNVPKAKPLTISNGTIRFSNVSFSYPSKKELLQDINLTVEGGKTLAIVGPSGSGKTTLSRLLYRFYDCTKGQILIDDQPINRITQDSLRKAIGIVPQDVVLFNDSIASNLMYASPKASEADLIQACRAAEIHEFIVRLPRGYNTEVGERGLKLSGGEKQRLAIARVFLKNPKILILDEASSALDSLTEQKIHNALKTLIQGRTTLIVAHRLSTIVHADHIVVLEQGRCVEYGTHTELLVKGGKYAELWSKQHSLDSHLN